MTDLMWAIADCGLVQFGRFEQSGQVWPFQLNLHYLPSYPEILRLVVQIAADKLEHKAAVDRILVPADSIPLGAAVAFHTGISLVYSRGLGEAAAYDLVGAYNAGHGAVLLCNILEQPERLNTLVASARQVGLIVRAAIVVLESRLYPGPDHIVTTALVSLPDLVIFLARENLLPAGQAEATVTWIAERSAANLHPGGAAP